MEYSQDFLKKLDESREKITYIKIISLTNDEFPREQIEGVVTGGSINIDGSSAIRRSCSLSLITYSPILTDRFWTYNNKFKLEIGLENLVDSKYPEIIWFKMGIYVITNFSKTQNNNGFSISLSGKDKMCRLNGEVSGNISSSVNFGTEEVVTLLETGEYQTIVNKIPIETIIQNAVKEYGQESNKNIIINDLQDYGYELMEYRGDEPAYIFIEYDTYNILNMVFDGSIEVDIWYDSQTKKFKLKDLGTIKCPFKFFSMNKLDNNYNKDANRVYWGDWDGNVNSPTCYIAKIEYGETAGYHRTPLVYNTDLILNAGSTVTTLLDKIKTMLGDFEYFYDLDGHFVFQKQKTYIQELFSPANGELVEPILYTSQYSYKFEDENLFTTLSNAPNINNLKNDFSIWGSRKGVGGGDIPIHTRYALDKKPKAYISPWGRYTRKIDLFFIIAKNEGVIPSTEDTFKTYYWYFKKNSDGIFHYIGNYRDYQNLISNQSDFFNDKTICEIDSYAILPEDFNKKNINEFIYEKQSNGDWKYNGLWKENYYYKNKENEYLLIKPSEITEDFSTYNIYFYILPNKKYSTSDYDWRELIYQMALDYFGHNQESDYLIKIEASNPSFIDGKTGYEQYYTDLQGFWRQLYNPTPSAEEFNNFYDKTSNDRYWNKQIHLDPNSLNFWFDFLDTEGELGNYSVYKIGTRSKVIKDDLIKSIYFKETPEILFIFPLEEEIEDYKDAYMPIYVQDYAKELFVRSAQGASAIQKTNSLIYQHVALSEGITISLVPIYYLQPNTRIYIKNQGDYVIDKISYQLSHNGTMTINGSKIMKQFY